jgi:hypothetical protein
MLKDIQTGSEYRDRMQSARASADQTFNEAIAGGVGGGNHDPADDLLNGKFRCKFHHATLTA